MSQPISSPEFPQLVDLVQRHFYKTSEDYEYDMRDGPLVRKSPQSQNTGLVVRFAEMIDINQYAHQVAAGAQIPETQAQYGYEKDLFINQIASQFSITDQLRISAKDYEQTVGDMIRRFSVVVPNRIELDLAHRLTFSYLSSYTNLDGLTVDITVGDGNPLAYGAHTLTGSSLTYSTIITNNPAFSKGSLEIALKSAREQTYDNFGLIVHVPFDVIFCTPDPNTMDSIDELLHATADVTSSNAGTFNVFGTSGQYKMRKFVINRLNTTSIGAIDTNKSKMWGVASSAFPGIVYSELKSPTVTSPSASNNGVDINTLNWIWDAVADYGICTPGARWIRISSGTGSNLTT